MNKLEFSREHARPIELFDAVAASNLHLASGSGEVHVYCLYFAPGGIIGEHPAGYAQLFLVIAGEGPYESELRKHASALDCADVRVEWRPYGERSP